MFSSSKFYFNIDVLNSFMRACSERELSKFLCSFAQTQIVTKNISFLAVFLYTAESAQLSTA